MVDKWASSQKKATVQLVVHCSTVSKLLGNAKIQDPNLPFNLIVPAASGGVQWNRDTL
jgi:hypothetical protein